jgi:predicted nucleotide-binding protein
MPGSSPAAKIDALSQWKDIQGGDYGGGQTSTAHAVARASFNFLSGKRFDAACAGMESASSLQKQELRGMTLNDVRGKIKNPRKDIAVTSPISVDGTILDPPPKMYFWLAIRDGDDGLVWPKMPPLTIDNNRGDFKAVIHEGGIGNGSKQLLLLGVSKKTNTAFMEWADQSALKGSWPGLSLAGRDATILDAVILMPELPVPTKPKERRTVFLVHGRNDARLHEVARYIERCVSSHHVTILREEPNGGRNILEKFEQTAATAEVAVVLLTADDEGRLGVDPQGKRGTENSLPLNPRGRQNVVFELGFFFAKLGRDRVIVLRDRAVEDPSDIAGLMYEPLEGDWKTRLLKELNYAGVTIKQDHWA